MLRSLGRDNRLFPRKLAVTQEGRWIIGVAILLGVGAVNTGNNLLYLVLSLLISIISISGILSELDLKGVTAERHYPRELVVGEAATLRVSVRNEKKRAGLHLEVDEFQDVEALDQQPGFVLHLAPFEVGSAFIVARPKRRGPIRTAGLRLSTTYPFGFARKSIIREASAHMLSLPAIERVELHVPGGRDRGEQERNPRAGQGTELRGLRDFRPGDAPRDMHWKVSARRGRAIAREWESEAARTAWIDFAHLRPGGLGAAPDGSVDPICLDRACAVVAGVAEALLQAGLAVGLRSFAGVVEPAADPDGSGQVLLGIRRHLAWLTVADAPPPPQWPLDDDAWADRHDAAARLAATLAEGGAAAMAGAEGRQGRERVLVLFASRADAALRGGEPTIRVWLDDDGAVLRTERIRQREQGAA